jgi:hypothetical protein
VVAWADHLYSGLPQASNAAHDLRRWLEGASAQQDDHVREARLKSDDKAARRTTAAADRSSSFGTVA